MFLFRYKRDFLLSISHENQAGVIQALHLTAHVHDMLHIDHNYFDRMENKKFIQSTSAKQSWWVWHRGPVFGFNVVVFVSTVIVLKGTF